jgi:hypothetical protein
MGVPYPEVHCKSLLPSLLPIAGHASRKLLLLEFQHASRAPPNITITLA